MECAHGERLIYGGSLEDGGLDWIVGKDGSLVSLSYHI